VASDGKTTRHMSLLGRDCISGEYKCGEFIYQRVAYTGLDPAKEVNKSRLANCIEDR